MAYQTNKLTAVPYFYDKQLRRYIQQFIRIFAGFQVAMHVDDAGEIVYQTVPVRYGDVSRMAAHIVRENSENMLQTTPFISCHVTGLETAPQMRTFSQYEETVPVYEKKFNEATNTYQNEVGNAYSIQRHQPVPYTLNMQVDLWTSNTEQKLQMLEQILVLFNPTLNIHTSNNPMDWSTLSYVELIASTWSMRAIPSGVDDIIDISTMSFTMPVLINPPAKVVKNSVIHTIIDNIQDVDANALSNLRLGQSYSPLFTSYKVVTLDALKMKFEVDSSGNETTITTINKSDGSIETITETKDSSGNDITIIETLIINCILSLALSMSFSLGKRTDNNRFRRRLNSVPIAPSYRCASSITSNNLESSDSSSHSVVLCQKTCSIGRINMYSNIE